MDRPILGKINKIKRLNPTVIRKEKGYIYMYGRKVFKNRRNKKEKVESCVKPFEVCKKKPDKSWEREEGLGR